MNSIIDRIYQLFIHLFFNRISGFDRQMIAERFFSLLQISQNKRILRRYAANFCIGIDNTRYIFSKIHCIWPFWVNRQLLFQSADYAARGFDALTINSSHRNWTILGAPGLDLYALVDPRGLVCPNPYGWSLDFWILMDGTLISPANLMDVRQQLLSHLPIIQTQFKVNGIAVMIETFFKPGATDDHFIDTQVSFENQDARACQFSFFFAVRPYHPEGMASVKEITYLSSNALMVNGQPGILFDQKPDNILCLPYHDGDVSERILEWQMILSARCPQQKASAAVQYQVKLESRDQKSFSARMPVSRTTPTKALADYATDKANVMQLWTNLRTRLCSIQIPDKLIESIFQSNISHLAQFIGDQQFHYSRLKQGEFCGRDLVFMIFGFNRSGLTAYSGTMLKALISHQNLIQQSEEYDYFGAVIVAVYDTYLYSKDLDLLGALFPLVNSCVSAIQTHIRSFSINSNSFRHYDILSSSYSFDSAFDKDHYLWDTFWALAGLRAAGDIARVMGDGPHLSSYTQLGAQLDTAVRHLMEDLFENGTSASHIPVTPGCAIDSRMIYSLASVFPLQIFPANDPIVTDTLSIIDQLFCRDHVFFNQVGQSGVSIFQNSLLAQTYLARGDANALRLLKFMVHQASPTACWPELMHPVMFGGISGNGHDGLAASSFVMLVRRLFIDDSAADRLILTPMIPGEWLSSAQAQIVVERMPTRFGLISFRIDYSYRRITYQISHQFHTKPTELMIQLPYPIARLRYGDYVRDIFNIVARVPIECSSVIFDLVNAA